MLAPHNFGHDAGSRPQPPSRVPALGPACRGRARRDQGGSSPSASPEGSRPGAPRFPQTPTWRRPPPPGPTPPRAAAGPGPREQAPANFPSPSAARRRPARPDRPPRHLPGPARAAAPRLRLVLVADSSRGLCLCPGPSFARCVGPREAGATGTRRARTLAGDFTAPPVEPDNGRPAGLPPARAPARPRSSAKHGHEHIRPALSSRFPRPAHRLAPPPSPRDRPEGRGRWRRPHPLGGPPGAGLRGALLCSEVTRAEAGPGKPGSPNLTFLTRASLGKELWSGPRSSREEWTEAASTPP